MVKVVMDKSHNQEKRASLTAQEPTLCEVITFILLLIGLLATSNGTFFSSCFKT